MLPAKTSLSASQYSTPVVPDAKNNSLISMAIAVAIICFWFVSLIGFLNLQLSHLPIVAILGAVWLRAFLHTGIFIIIHDSIHGVVSQRSTS